MSLIGIPASAKATDAAVMAAHLVPACASTTCISTRIDALGNSSTITTFSKACETM